MKTSVGPVLHLAAVEIALPFFFFITYNPSNQISSSFFSEVLNLVHRVIGQFRWEGTFESNLEQPLA